MSEEENITQAQLDTFADKLTEWGKGLSVSEQALLNVVLAAPAPRPPRSKASSSTSASAPRPRASSRPWLRATH